MSDLSEMIRALIEEGLDPREAARVAVQTLKGTKLSRTEGEKITSPRAADYGNESAEQARRRWEEQERRDPQGVFSGGMSGGGVFGQGAIATEGYDPEAIRRTVDMQSALQGALVQQQTLRTLEEMRKHLEASRPREIEAPPRRQLSFSKILGKKRRQ